MKGFLIGAAVLTAALLLSGENGAGTDIAKLEPAQVLWVEESAGYVSVSTDIGQSGRGTDLAAAVRDMEQAASGTVFLDTAEYLLLSPSAEEWLPELAELLRGSCRVCLVEGTADLEAVGAYLAVHKPGVTLRDCRKGSYGLPLLSVEGERMYLANP